MKMKEQITIYNLKGDKDRENGGCYLDRANARLGYGTFPYKRCFLANLDLVFTANVEEVRGKNYFKLTNIEAVEEDKCKFVVELQKQQAVKKSKIKYFFERHSMKDLKTKEVDYFCERYEFGKAMATKFREVYNNIFESCALNKSLKDKFKDDLTYDERDDIVNVSKTVGKDIFKNPFIYWPSDKSKIKDDRKHEIAEMMRKKMKMADNDERRIVAYMKHVLKKDRNEGHCYMLWKQFVAAMNKMLGPDFSKDVEKCLESNDFFHTQGNEIYLKLYYHYERDIAQLIQNMLKRDKLPPMEVDAPDLDPTQRKAIDTALNSSLSFICGGPGTGKTKIIQTILGHLQGETVHLLASTHKAANHLKKVCERHATTFHKVTCLSERPKFQDYYATFIIDEISMMDVYWACRFFNAFANHAKRIILVGDHFQLASVGAGAIARDLYGHPLLPQVELKTCYRTNSKTIHENAMLLRNQKFTTPFKEDDSFQTIKYGMKKESLEKYLSRAIDAMENAYSPDSPAGVKILCQINKDVKIANSKAQARFNPEGVPCPINYWKIVAKKNPEFRIGDRIKVLEQHGEHLSADDEGTIIGWTQNGATIRFDNGYEDVIEKPQQIAHSYAVTIHKGQGAEFSNVFVVLSHLECCQSLESIYTGITRTKDRCVLFYPTHHILKLARSNRLNRRTKLRQQLNKRSIEYLK